MITSNELFLASGRQHHVLISYNTKARKNYHDSNMIHTGNVTLLLLGRLAEDYFAANVDRCKFLYSVSTNTLFCTHYFGNVIYHTFSHDDVSIRINEGNINVMLEFV